MAITPAQTTRRLSLLALTAVVVGSMVGAGIFSLPRSFGGATGGLGAFIAWCIAGTGMYALALVFRMLAERRPDLDTGIYAYAKAGFGDYAGFLSAFGYWLVGCIADVSYWVLIKSALGAFVPAFGDGNTVPAVVTASVGLWLFHFLVLSGIRQAAFVNTVVTVAKLVPILVFIVILIVAFKADLFAANFWGGEAVAETSLFGQVRATMLVTVFAFIGIEGASVYSRYARRRADVGTATTLGFLAVTALMVLVTLLPYGALPRPDIAGMRQPSMAGVLEAVVGPWGGVFVSLGLIVSVLGAYLAWTLISIEVLFAAAKSGDMPRVLAGENGNGVPTAALWLTNSVIQLFLVSTLLSDDAFTLMVKLTGSMVLIPYLLVAAYGFLVARGDEADGTRPWERRRDRIVAGIAALYAAFLIFAAGPKFAVLSAVLYAPGTLLYVRARRERGMRVFAKAEWLAFVGLSIGCAIGLYGLLSGSITL